MGMHLAALYIGNITLFSVRRLGGLIPVGHDPGRAGQGVPLCTVPVEDTVPGADARLLGGHVLDT